MSAVIDLVALTLLPLVAMAARRRAASRRSGCCRTSSNSTATNGRAAACGHACPGARRAALPSAERAVERAIAAGPRLRRVERPAISGRAPRDRRSTPGALGAWIRSPLRPARRSRSSDRASGSAYALAVAERLSADLAARGLVVTSGLARGVDSAAHRGALSVGGRTLAVLGCGVDVVYPREHAGAGAEIVANRCHRERTRAGNAAAGPVLSAAQSHHQRPVAGGRRDRSWREERVADHRAVCARAGSRRARRAGQHSERPKSRRTRAAARRSKDCRVCGRYC